MHAASWIDYVRLPAEISDFERSWLARMNRVALGFFWLNLPLFVAVAFFNETGPLLAVVLTGLVLVGPTVALGALDNPRAVSMVHGFTAMCLGGLLVHFGQGPVQIEMHFYFFSLLAVLAMFGNPTVIIVAAVTVTLHHTVVWAIIPRSVFNYDASVWVIAIHAAFVVVESIAACFIARSFFDNVIGLEKLVGQRTQALEQRNQDLRTVLDNVREGLVTVYRDGRLSSERSAVIERWFPGEATTLRELVEPVDADFAARLEVAWDMLIDGFMPTDVALHQLPRRLVVGDRVLCLQFFVVEACDERVESLLLVISDVTDAERRAQAEARQKEAFAVFHHFLADKSGFLEFFADAQHIVDDLVAEQHGGDVVVAKRLLHTLKGNSALYGMHRLAELVHAIEDGVVETAEPPTRAQLRELRDRWTESRQQLDDLVGERQSGIELSEEEYLHVLTAIEAGRSPKELSALIRAWRLEPAVARLGRVREQARGIAERVQKPDVEIEVDAGDVRLSAEQFRPFWSSFVHILRNALDHGIEPEEERAARGKAGSGRIRLAATVEDDAFVVTVSDDGRGIDWEAVADKARTMGLAADTEIDLLTALFTDGITTRKSASLLSGRGVGLGAVKEAVEELGGRIQLESSSEVGTRFRFTFPLTALEDAVWTGPEKPEPLPTMA